MSYVIYISYLYRVRIRNERQVYRIKITGDDKSESKNHIEGRKLKYLK